MYWSKCGMELPEGSVFCLQCGNDLRTASNQPTSIKESSSGVMTGLSIGAVLIALAFAVIVGVVIVAYVYNESSKRDAETQLPGRAVAQENPPVKQPQPSVVLDKTFPVGPGAYVSYALPLKADLTHVTGHFTAQGGNNDIEVFVLDQDGLANFSNRHNARTYYNSEGYINACS